MDIRDDDDENNFRVGILCYITQGFIDSVEWSTLAVDFDRPGLDEAEGRHARPASRWAVYH
jgi:hypothetical protein